jgi:hypothetical protein
MPIRESQIEARVRRYCILKGVICYKFVSPGKRGVPDRLLIGPHGNMAFLELKAPGKRPGALQRRELAMLRKRRVPAFYRDSYEGAKKIIDALCRGHLSLMMLVEFEKIGESYPPIDTGSIRRSIDRSNIFGTRKM